MQERQRLRVFTWHIHGSYLYYLTQTPCTFYLPHKSNSEPGYGARTPNFPWGDNVVSIPAEDVKNLEFDCILFQSQKNYMNDQFELLTEHQRSLPRIYLEHDPPRETPVDTTHVVADPDVLIVHVTHFNRLMWDNQDVPATVVEHGVTDPGYLYTGELPRGIVVVNGIRTRGRRLGLDIYLRLREKLPLDIIGMDSQSVGGLGEVRNEQLPSFISRYRFFFNPIRYTSLGLAVCEAMMTGLPIVGLATTEMPITIRNDYSGFISTDEAWLVRKMRLLLDNPDTAKRLSEGARDTATSKFNIERFTSDWLKVFQAVVDRVSHRLFLSDEIKPFT